ncbi:MAG: prepilin-type N-terminal cleavage/methylation domain-containing protein, partial [Culicoidibacterales bacterium]
MRFNNQKGISLVEIIAAIAIIGIVAVVFSTSIGIMMRNEQ